VLVEDIETGKTEFWYPDGVFVFIGLSPNVNFELPGVERDRYGFIKTDSDLMTTAAGVFAAGDVRGGSTKQAASAAGEGATVALMIRQYLQTLGDVPHSSSLEAAI
jgi:thioredoxin reductase (NADPH)